MAKFASVVTPLFLAVFSKALLAKGANESMFPGLAKHSVWDLIFPAFAFLVVIVAPCLLGLWAIRKTIQS